MAESRKKRADAVTLRKEATDAITLALALERVYEFGVDADRRPVLLDNDTPYVAHSWTKAEAVHLPDRADFRYGTGNSSIGLPTGVTVVIGGAGKGKTKFAYEHLFARAVRDGFDARYYQMFEPGARAAFSRVDGGKFVRPVFEIDFAHELADALLAPNPVLAIWDSARYLFFKASAGATGKGGVNMGLFMTLSHLDTIAMELGKHLVITVNPLTNDPDALAFYEEAAKGAVSAVIAMDNFQTARLSSRIAKTRDFTPIQLGAKTIIDNVVVRHTDAFDGLSTLAMGGGQPNDNTVPFFPIRKEY